MKKYSKLMAVLLVVAMLLPGIAQAAPVAGEVTVERLEGLDRVGTAIEVSKEAYKGAETVVLAGRNGSADALTGTLLAVSEKAPLLLAGKNELTKEVKDQIAELKAKKVIILGGTSAVSKEIEAEIVKLGLEVERVEGLNRFETAAKIAGKAGKTTDAFLALGRGATTNGTEDALADALAVGPASGKTGNPVLLTEKGKLPEATKTAIKDLGVKNITIVGGASAVTEEVVTELKTLDVKVTRLFGDSREETAIEVAKKHFADASMFVMANGRSAADALVGGYLGALKNAPILLTTPKAANGLSAETKAYLEANRLTSAYVLGGTTVINDTTLEAIEVALGVKEEVEGELVVESVSAISKTDVTVDITKLTEDIEGATIEVKDNNGNVVEVKPLNLVINEVEAKFVFKTALTSNPAGVWTIAGISFDADEYAKVDKINKATTELSLYNALTAAGIKNLKVANSGAYFSAEKPVDGFKTLVEVQDFVNKVNAEEATDEENAKLVEALVKALAGTSDVAIVNALAPWSQVNEDFLATYKTDLAAMNTNAGPDETIVDEFKNVQTVINATNVTEVGTLVSGAKTSAKKADYTKAVAAMKFVREDDPKVTSDKAKADLQKDLDLLNLVINVKESSTAARFANAYNALVAHVNNKTTIGTEEFYTGLRTKYMEVTKVLDVAETVTDAAGIEAAIVKVNTQKRAELFNDVANIVDTAGATQTSTANVLKALQALAVYSDKADFDIKTVETTTARLEAYRTGLSTLTVITIDGTETAASVKTAIQSVQTEVTTVNGTAVGTPLSAIAALSSPSDGDLLDALNHAELGLKNVVDANVDAYQADLAIIQAAATVGSDTAAKAIKKLEVVLKDINLLVDINKATTAKEIHTALLALSGNGDYINVPSADRLYVANLVLENRNEEIGKVFATLEDATDALGTEAGKYDTALGLVNDIEGIAGTPSTISQVITALEFDADFAEMTSGEQSDIAEAFLLGLEFNIDGTLKTPFRTLAAVRTAAGL